MNDGFFAVVAVFSAVLAGAILAPVFLPWLPGRAFSNKGLTLGFAAALALIICRE